MDPGREQAILEDLDPNTANQIRKKLYTIEVIFQVPDKDLQKVMRDYADKEIAMIVKGVEESVRDRLLASISERRQGFIRLEADALGAVRKTDVDAAIQDFLAYLQMLEQKGEIAILRGREQYV
jgi:flagellar motor switch protein FliG